MMSDLNNDDSTCQEPCDPAVGCEQCVEYWQRMETEGLWDMKNHCWTELGRKILLLS